MKWNLDNDSPIYAQLVDQIKFAIVSGELAPGARMATVRELALEAGVNPNTMQRALQQLEREGLVHAQRSSGRFVTEDVGEIDRAKAALAESHIRRFRESMSSLGYSEAEIQELLKHGKEEEKHGKLS